MATLAFASNYEMLQSLRFLRMTAKNTFPEILKLPDIEPENEIEMKDFPPFNQFCDLADEIIRQIPDKYKKGISGIYVTPEEVKDEEIPGVYVLGNYHHGGYVEPTIDIYYGSFRQIFRGLPLARLQEELWETITHEIRHHLEVNAGLHILEIYDQELKESFRSDK